MRYTRLKRPCLGLLIKEWGIMSNRGRYDWLLRRSSLIFFYLAIYPCLLGFTNCGRSIHKRPSFSNCEKFSSCTWLASFSSKLIRIFLEEECFVLSSF